MHLALISLALCVAAAFFGSVLAQGFVAGQASPQYFVLQRTANPVGFWLAQAFNGIIATACLAGAVIVVSAL